MINWSLGATLILTLILGACGTAGDRSFYHKKYLHLKALKPANETAFAQDSIDRPWTNQNYPEQSSIEINPEIPAEEPAIAIEEFSPSDIWPPDGRFRHPVLPGSKFSTLADDEEEPSQTWAHKSKTYTTWSFVLVMATIGIVLFTAWCMLLVLMSNLSPMGIFYLLWFFTFFFIGSMFTAGMGLHFARKSIVYDKLDKRKTLVKQRVLLWMSFLLLLASFFPFLVMINYFA